MFTARYRLIPYIKQIAFRLWKVKDAFIYFTLYASVCRTVISNKQGGGREDLKLAVVVWLRWYLIICSVEPKKSTDVPPVIAVDVPTEVTVWHLALSFEPNWTVREKRPLLKKKKCYTQQLCYLLRLCGVIGRRKRIWSICGILLTGENRRTQENNLS